LEQRSSFGDADEESRCHFSSWVGPVTDPHDRWWRSDWGGRSRTEGRRGALQTACAELTPSMEAAQRLYAKRGFERVPGLDFSRGKRSYCLYALSIDRY